MPIYHVDPDIRKATTLPAEFYQSDNVFSALKDQVFTQSWQWLGDESLVPLNESVFPLFFMENFLNEPMVLTRNATGSIGCLSNVCTHRANLVVQHPGQQKELMCQYHGRRFDIDGTFKSMPKFKEAVDFPRPCDDLARFPLHQWGPFLFATIDPVFDFKIITNKIEERIGFLPLDQFKPDTSLDKDYLINCHWVFPNMMFNFYPWGLSINVVQPINKEKTRVSFMSYVYDESKLHSGAGASLDKVEREDEFVVENVHRGLQSRVYQQGRFSPTMEQGVHYFHRLLADLVEI